MASLEGFGAIRADGNALATDIYGSVHRIWRDPTSGDLKYAVRDSNEFWSGVTTIDDGQVGTRMSIVIDSRRRPNIAYYDEAGGNLMFARRDEGGWVRQVVDSSGDVGDFASVRVVRSGTAYISYYDRTNGDLKFAWQPWVGIWTSSVVDSAGDVGQWSSLSNDSSSLQIAYTDATTHTLCYAIMPAGGGWTKTTIDATTSNFDYVSMALDPTTNAPRIAYRDGSAKTLKLASKGAAGWSTQAVAAGNDDGYYATLTYADSGKPTVVHLDKSLGTIDRTTFFGTGPKTRYLALGGDYVSATSGASGLVFDRVDPRTGLLNTSRNRFEYVTESDPSQRVIQWDIIGGSSNDLSKRRVGWSLDTTGWSGFYNGRIAPLRSYGLKRVLLHNPFGTLPNEGYQFDQYLHAQQAGLTWLTNGFVQTWKPAVDSGMEVIAYIGSLWDDPDFIALENNPKAYMQRIMASLQPYLQTGMSIGLDSVVYQDANSWSLEVSELLRESGIRVYAENRPPRNSTWWHDFDGIYHDDGYQLSQPALDPIGGHTAPNYLLRGEIVRWLAHEPPGWTFSQLGWRGPDVIRIISEGNTAATDLWMLRAEGWTLAQLYHLATYGSGSRPAAADGTKVMAFDSGVFAKDLVDELQI